MPSKFSLKKSLLTTTALLSGILLLPHRALAVSCPTTITGTSLAGEACDFDSSSQLTISADAEVGNILQSSYNASGQIINYGTINTELEVALNITNSSLNGITNNGVIFSSELAAISIDDNSIISNGITNSGSLTSTNYITLQVINDSVINGDINNSGSITSNSDNNPAILMRSNVTLTGDFINSGSIQGGELGSGIHFDSNSLIQGDINNSGSITGYNAVHIGETNIAGGIINSGIITGNGINGINVINSVTLSGGITNSGSITGENHGIRLEGFNLIFGGITNEAGATITGTNGSGIFIYDNSPVFGNIKNYGTITGAINAIYIDTDSTSADIDTYAGSKINGAIDAQATTVNIHGGEINGTMNVRSVNIDSGATFNMTHAITVDNALNNAGTLAVGSDVRTIIGNYTQNTGGIFSINAQSTSNYGQLVVSDAVNLSQSGAIDVNVLSGANFIAGDVLSDVISGNTLTAPSGGTYSVTDNSRLVNFVGSNNANGVDLEVVSAASNAVAQSVGSSAGAGAAHSLDNIISANPGGDWNNVLGALNSLSSDSQVADAVNQTTPALAGASNTALIETTNMAMRIVQARQESIAGLSSGDDIHTDKNVWVKAFGSWGDQQNKDGVIGYDSNSYGFISGADKAVNDKARLGLGFSYFNSKLASNNAMNHVNVDSFLGIAYGSYSLDDKTDINTQLAFGYNRSEAKRNINFGNLSRSAKGNYDGWNFHAGTGISRKLKIDNDTTIAPQLRLDYYSVSNESYDEKGAGVLNLRVASQRQAQLIPAVEVKADHKINRAFSFSLNGGLGYDLLQDRNSVSASFEGGEVFVTQGLKASPWVVRSGAGITWKKSDDVDFTARYDRRDRGSYDNQTLSFKVRLMF